MKRILLASAATFAFAGAAAAQVEISGSGTVGWNDDFLEGDVGEAGFYNDLDFDIIVTQELDYGVTLGVVLGFEYVDSDAGGINNGTTGFGDFTDDNFLVSLTSDMGAFYFGDTAYAAQTYWSGVTNMEFDSFSEADGETVIRGEVMIAGVTAGLSYGIDNDDFGTGTGDLNQMSLGATGSFGAFNFVVAYQEEADVDFSAAALGGQGDFVAGETLGLAVGGSFAGADVTLAYSKQTDIGSSTGIEVSYPVGPVTGTVFYVMNDADVGDVDDNYGIEVEYASGPIAVSARYHDGQDEEFGIEGSYDVGNGLTVFAGYIDEMENGANVQEDEVYYIAAEADLGGGASLLVSYADVDAGGAAPVTTLDEIGANDYKLGTTVAFTFSF